MQNIQTMKLNNNGADMDDHSAGHKWPPACDICQSAVCKVYCRADDAYLCSTCDSRIHAANHLASRHERVWVCDACDCAPAAFLCKADAASLCSACDATTHSANSLAGRHQRVPIVPISGCSLNEKRNVEFLAQGEEEEEEDEDEAASWLFLNPVKNISNQISYLFGEDVDDYLDLDDYNPGDKNQFNEHEQSRYHMQPKQEGIQQTTYGGDSVVPIGAADFREQSQQQKGQNFSVGFGFDYSKADYSYNCSFTQSVSGSSMDVGIVPESTLADVSLTPDPRLTKQNVETFSSSPIQMPQQLNQMDREARVLRYREKKKSRKFEKTIRYASRKAYAETRPRIKGRFAKRTERTEGEVDQIFPTTVSAGSGYGIFLLSDIGRGREE